jgi:hypothetical protein
MILAITAVIATTFTIAGFVINKSILAFIGGAFWFMFGISSFMQSASSNPTNITDVYMGLFWLGIALMITCVLEPALMGKPKEEVIDKKMTENEELEAEMKELMAEMRLPRLGSGRKEKKGW